MVDDNELNRLRDIAAPAPGNDAKARAFGAAMRAYDMGEKTSPAAKGSAKGLRLTERAQKLWSEIMQKKLFATPAIAGLVALPIAGYATIYMLQEQPFYSGGDEKITETLADKPVANAPATVRPLTVAEADKRKKADADAESRVAAEALAPASPPKPESNAMGGLVQAGCAGPQCGARAGTCAER